MKKNKRGFTLSELLIVVAIIAVLVLVSVPILMSNLGDTKATVCLANQTSLKHALNVKLLSGSTYEELHTYADANREEFPCPEGGEYGVDIYEDIITITCPIHGTSDTAGFLIRALKESGVNWDHVKRVDSNTTEGSRTSAIKAYLEEAGITLDAESWAIIRTKAGSEEVLQVVWSTYETPLGTNYTSIPAIAYNTETKEYTVGMTDVTTKENEWFYGNVYETYNIIAAGSEGKTLNLSDPTTYTSATEAQRAYKALDPVEG